MTLTVIRDILQVSVTALFFTSHNQVHVYTHNQVYIYTHKQVYGCIAQPGICLHSQPCTCACLHLTNRLMFTFHKHVYIYISQTGIYLHFRNRYMFTFHKRYMFIRKQGKTCHIFVNRIILLHLKLQNIMRNTWR